MNRITNSLSILLCSVAMLGVGLAALAVRVTEDVSTVSQYNSNIESARERAAKDIVYYAKQDYLRAFSIYPDDQELFREFLTFLETSQDESFRTYLKTYLRQYPNDLEAYEKLCDLYYAEENYKEIQNILQEAIGAGVQSDKLAFYWDEVVYKFVKLPGGYSDSSVFYGKQAIIERNGKKGLYSFGSGLVLDPVYDDITYSINNVIAVKDEDGYYFADNAGNKCGVLNQSVDSLSILSNGFSAVSVEGKYGYVTETLEVPEQLPYEYATAFSNDVAAVKVGGKWGLVNTDGEYVVEPVYDDVKLTEFNTAVSAGVIFVKEGEVWKMVNNQGQYLSEEGFEEVHTFLTGGQPAAVKYNGKWCFVQTTGEIFDPGCEIFAAKSYNNGLAPVTLDGTTWGYMDMYGKIAIEPQFTDCKQFSEYGVAPVKQEELWSFIQLLSYR